MPERLSILLLCNRPAVAAEASTVNDHLDAFGRFSRHRVAMLSFLSRLPVTLDLERFDVAVIHYTTALGYPGEHYIDAEARARVRRFPGLKVAFIQDEYRGVNAVVEALRFMKIDVLFTCFSARDIPVVYPPEQLPDLRAVPTLAGYVPERLLERTVRPVVKRAVDVGYRARRPPYWLGELGVEKWRIADRFRRAVARSGLRLDLSCRESDRLYGRRWDAFMASCKATLGVESGASVIDFDGTLQQRVDEYTASNPGVTFEEIQDRFLLQHEGGMRLAQISPRCFEAAALRTAMVLTEGAYSGVLEPWRHYLPLRKDFANLDEIVDALRQPLELQEIVDRTYQEIACNPGFGYRHFIEQFDRVVEEELARRGNTRQARPSSHLRLGLDLARSPGYVLHLITSRVLQRLLLGTPLRRVLLALWERVPRRSRRLVRPLLRLIGR